MNKRDALPDLILVTFFAEKSEDVVEKPDATIKGNRVVYIPF